MLQHRAVTENYLRQQKTHKHCSIRETFPVLQNSARLFGTKCRYTVPPACTLGPTEGVGVGISY